MGESLDGMGQLVSAFILARGKGSRLIFTASLTCSGDYMQGTYLKFRTKEDAIHFW